MWNEILAPVVILALIVALSVKLRLWYANRLANMTPAERRAEEKSQDSEQWW